MTLFHSLLLGIIQGLTEFIPVSSTAHLLIGQQLLGIPSNGRVFSFQVIIQMGTVFVLLIFFWQEIWSITRAFLLGIWHRDPFKNHESQLGWLLLIATIPALIAGFLLKDVVEKRFADPALQAGVRLLMSAALLAGVESFGQRNRKLESATWLDALTVGIFQVFALFPGASRSGSTIAGGMMRGFDRPSAARFAFFMSVPILIAAGGYEMINLIMVAGAHDFLPVLATGFITAAVVGWLALKWLIGYLNEHSLYIFAAYCAVVGIICLAIYWI